MNNYIEILLDTNFLNDYRYVSKEQFMIFIKMHITKILKQIDIVNFANIEYSALNNIEQEIYNILASSIKLYSSILEDELKYEELDDVIYELVKRKIFNDAIDNIIILGEIEYLKIDNVIDKLKSIYYYLLELEIYNYYKRQGWKYQQYIACLDPLGEIRGKSSFALKPEQYGRFLVELFNLWYEDWKNGEHPYIRQFENYIGILLGYQPESCEQRGICGIQNVVEADGSVYPCDFYMLDEYRLGNFNSDRLVEIDEKRKSIAFVEQSQKSAKDCIECKFHTLCRGGCRRNREFDVAKGEYANYYCESYRFFFEQCLEKMIHIVETIKR